MAARIWAVSASRAILRIEFPGSDDRRWLAMRIRLWPEVPEAEHLRDMAESIARGHFVRLAVAPDGSAIGLVEASKRVDYGNGTTRSPVAFLEGLYVEPAARRKGIARSSYRSRTGRRRRVWSSSRRIRPSRTSRLMPLIARSDSKRRSA